MKVFEVTTEYAGPDKDLIREVAYVTSEADTLKSVTDYYTEHCYQYEKDLKAVREVLTIVQHIE